MAEGVVRVRVVSWMAVTMTVSALPAVSVIVSAKGRVALTKLAALTVAVRVRHCKEGGPVTGSQFKVHHACIPWPCKSDASDTRCLVYYDYYSRWERKRRRLMLVMCR